MKEIWGIKYRPSTLDRYVFQNEDFRQKFERMVHEKQIPHLLLSGVQGTGKTTLAHILINSLNIDPDMDLMVIDASKQNSVDHMRNQIMDFVSSYPVGDFKVVLLEEADYLSLSAQALLRTPLEDPAVSARFIMTCNYDHKIMPAIKSRMEHYQFAAPDYDAVLLHLAEILAEERVKFDIDTLEYYVKRGYPDIRKTINLLQTNSHTGTLQRVDTQQSSPDYKLTLTKLISENDWERARSVVCTQVTQGEWEDVYRYLYDNLHTMGKFKQQDKYNKAIQVIAEHLYKHSIVADSEINAAAMFVSLSLI